MSFLKKHKKPIAIAGVTLGLGIAGYALVDSVGAAAIFGGVRRGSREVLIEALRSDPDISESLTSQRALDFVNTFKDAKLSALIGGPTPPRRYANVILES